MIAEQVTSPPLTGEAVGAAVSALGLRPGDTVLVHSSLRRLGWVCGGAPAVVRALLDVIGPTGTLAVPTHTADNRDPATWTHRAVPPEWRDVVRDHLPAFDPATTPSFRMGAVAECVRTWPGAVRSGHPQVSFVAVGPEAERLTADHPLDCHLGERSPLRRLEDLDGKVLLLGVGWEACTAFHLAEYRQEAPAGRDYSCVVADGGRRAWVTYRDIVLDDRPFPMLGADLERDSNPVRSGAVGAGQARLVPIRAAVDFATDWMAARSAAESRATRTPVAVGTG